MTPPSPPGAGGPETAKLIDWRERPLQRAARRLVMRAERLERLIEHGAPDNIVSKERELIAKAIVEYDECWQAGGRR